MKHSKRWIMVVPLLAGLQLSACGQTAPPTTSKPEPAHVEAIPGSELSQVILEPQAATRLDIQTVAVREEQVMRTRTVGGEILAEAKAGATNTSGTTRGAATSRDLLVRVPLTASDLAEVDRSQRAKVLPLVRVEGATGADATLVDPPAGLEAKLTDSALFYAVKSAAQELTPGQRVRIELSLNGSGAQRTVVPYSAVLYDLHGETWVYTSPELLSFVRERVEVDYIEGDLAVLNQAPSVGTQIVSVGVAELYGTETGVGH